MLLRGGAPLGAPPTTLHEERRGRAAVAVRLLKWRMSAAKAADLASPRKFLTREQIMNRPSLFQRRLQVGLSLATITVALLIASLACVTAADPKPEKAAKPEKASKKPEKKKLTGAELYALNCNRCHAERYATEWTSAQWKTLMLHMRVRANLPASQAKAILKYLQEDAGN